MKKMSVMSAVMVRSNPEGSPKRSSKNDARVRDPVICVYTLNRAATSLQLSAVPMKSPMAIHAAGMPVR